MTELTNDSKPQQQVIANPTRSSAYDLKTTPNSWANCQAAGAGLDAMAGGIGHTQWTFDFHNSGNAVQTNGAWVYTGTLTGKVIIMP